MVDTINAQERLDAVNGLILSCETVANEIETAFSSFDSTLGESEAKSQELISNIEDTKVEVTTHANIFLESLIQKIGEINDKVNGFVSQISELLSALESSSDDLSANLQTMDGAHDEIKGQIDENISHLEEVFASLSSVWIAANEQIMVLQQESDDSILQDVKSQSETLDAEQQTNQEQLTQTLSDGFDSLVNQDIAPHVASLTSHLADDLIPDVESRVEQNRQLQEQGGSEFGGLRSNAVDSMFDSAERLYDAVEGVMTVMTTTVNTTSTIADVTVDAMDQTNVGLNQLNQAIDNLLSLLGGLSLD